MKNKLLIISAVAACFALLMQASVWLTTRTPDKIANLDGIKALDIGLKPAKNAPDKAKLLFEREPAAVKANKVPLLFPNFPLHVPQRIDLNADDGTRKRLSEREWWDQVRDWLLLTVVGDSGLPAYEIGGALFDLPPLRYGYLKASGQFEYGESRSCFIGDGRIIALVPADASQAARDDAIADVIDRHRKDQAGEIESVELFEYQLIDDGLTASVTRLASLKVAPYLSPKKGYHETTVTSRSDLNRFLNQTDDLIYAEITSEGLRLGGRKIQSYNYRGIGLQEVAAVWQSEQDIAIKDKEFQNFVKEEQAALTNRWRNRTYKTDYEKRRLEAEYDRDFQQVKAKIQKRAQEMRLVDGSGFSLDPTYDFAGFEMFISQLLAHAEELDADTSAQVGDRQTIETYLETIRRIKPQLLKASDAFSKENIVPMLNFIEELKVSDNLSNLSFLIGYAKINKMKPQLEQAAVALSKKDFLPWRKIIDELWAVGNLSDFWLAFALKYGMDGFRYQAARYDGTLQGTEAGMVLFYTDLLAKIWAINYLDSSPIDQINGFVDHTRVQLSPIYSRESQELSRARLWFGPTDRGFQVAQDFDQIFFQRISTRVYSKGRNPLDPANEVQTSAFLAAPIDWWDDHYEEIARYEPEYFRLNEIMKWSLLIGFLAEGGNGGLLDFLDAVEVDRSNWFPHWSSNNEELRFNLWNQIRFFDKGYMGTTTEAMQYLWGKVTAGGVSLAPKKLFRNRARIAPSINKRIRRSNINYASARTGSGEFKTLDGVTVSLQRRGPERVFIQNTPKPGLRLRAPDSDMFNAPFERIITKTGDGIKVRAAAGETGLGELNIGRTSNGFKVGWQARDIDAGQTLALRASRSTDPETVFASDPAVEQLIKLPNPDTYAVKLNNSEKWMIAGRGGGNDSTVGGGWHSRVADPKRDGGSYQLMWVDRKVVEQQASQSQWLTLGPSSDGRLVIADIHTRGPPTKEITDVQLIFRKKSMDAKVNRSTGEVYISTKNLTESFPQGLLDIQRRIRPEHISEIRTAAANIQDGARIPINGSRGIEAALKTGNVRRIAVEIAKTPEKADWLLRRALGNDLKGVLKLIENREIGTAMSQLARLRQVYGPQPEFRILEGVAELSRGRPNQAAQAIGKSTPGSIRNPDVFFREIHARLEDSTIGRQSRDNMENFVSFVGWPRKSRGAAESGGYAIPRVEDGVLGFEFRFVDPLRGGRDIPARDAKRIWESGAPFYRQDSPGLNNLDWNVSQTHAFAQAIDMQLGKVVELPRGDVASLNPTKIIAPAADIKSVTGKRVTELVRTSAGRTKRVPIPVSGGECDEQSEECSKMEAARPSADRIYFLVEGS